MKLKNKEMIEYPNEFYYIEIDGSINKYDPEDLWRFDKKDLIEFGNCFETKEEAELAVEKLKAWKRLKDKGFEFTGTVFDVINFGFSHEYKFTPAANKEAEKDLNLLFGGEE